MPTGLLHVRLWLSKVSPLLQDMQGRRPAAVYVVSAALHARGRPVLRVLGVPVLRPAHATVQAVSRVVPRLLRPGPVQLFGVHVPAAPGPEKLAVRVVLRTAAARRLLHMQRGHRRVSQPDAGGETPDVGGQRTGQPGRGRGVHQTRPAGEIDRARRHAVRILGPGHDRYRPSRRVRGNG